MTETSDSLTSEPMDTSPAPAPCPPVVKRGRGGDHRSALRGKAAAINLSLQQQDGAGKDTTRILMAPDIAAALKIAVAVEPPPSRLRVSATPPARRTLARKHVLNMIVTMLQCRVLYSQVVFADCLQVIDKLSGQVLALEESNVKFTEEVRNLQAENTTLKYRPLFPGEADVRCAPVATRSAPDVVALLQVQVKREAEFVKIEQQQRAKSESRLWESRQALAQANDTKQQLAGALDELARVSAELSALRDRHSARDATVAAAAERRADLECRLTATRESELAALQGIAQLQHQLEGADHKREQLEINLSCAQAKADRLETELLDVRVETRGRKKGHAGRALLEEKWDGMSALAREQAMRRHTHDICDYLEERASDWEPSAFAASLEWLDLLPELFSTRPLRKWRMAFARELREMLHAEWGVDQALYLKTELSLSDSQYQRLRLSLSKRYVQPVDEPVVAEGATARKVGWQNRLWFRDDVTDEVLYMPEPLVSRYKWLPKWRGYLEKYGMSCDTDGKVARRGFLQTATAQIQRDAALGQINLFTSASRPWYPCWHLDALSLSAKRGITHGGTTLGALYQGGHTQSELKLQSMVVGLYKDNLSGQREMMGDGETEGIAAEIRDLDAGGAIGIELPDDPEWILVNHCKPLGCLDFAGVRDTLAKRGKCAALCGCRTLAKLQCFPGDGTIPALPEGDSLEDWKRAVVDVFTKHCDYGTAATAQPSLDAAGHFPPADWDPVRDGPWICEHCSLPVWKDWDDFKRGLCNHTDLVARAADGDEEVAKGLEAVLKAHAETHHDAKLLERVVVRIGSKWLIVDPMHGLELNVAKTGFKYCFSDRMLDPQREAVAAYLVEIDCPLDVREKHKRDSSQK